MKRPNFSSLLNAEVSHKTLCSFPTLPLIHSSSRHFLSTSDSRGVTKTRWAFGIYISKVRTAGAEHHPVIRHRDEVINPPRSWTIYISHKDPVHHNLIYCVSKTDC